MTILELLRIVETESRIWNPILVSNKLVWLNKQTLHYEAYSWPIYFTNHKLTGSSINRSTIHDCNATHLMPPSVRCSTVFSYHWKSSLLKFASGCDFKVFAWKKKQYRLFLLHSSWTGQSSTHRHCSALTLASAMLWYRIDNNFQTNCVCSALTPFPLTCAQCRPRVLPVQLIVNELAQIRMCNCTWLVHAQQLPVSGGSIVAI